MLGDGEGGAKILGGSVNKPRSPRRHSSRTDYRRQERSMLPFIETRRRMNKHFLLLYAWILGGSVAEWLACWTQVQKGPGFKSQSRRCRVTVLGKLFTPIVPLFTSRKIGSSPLKGCGDNYRPGGK